MSEDDQNRWLDDLSYVDMAGSRVVDTDLRRKYLRHYHRLVDLPYSQEIIKVLQELCNSRNPSHQTWRSRVLELLVPSRNRKNLYSG